MTHHPASHAEWMPISSAPRDGARFFGSSYYVSDSTGNAAMWVAHFDQECGHFRSSWDLEPLYDMTNWLPLPPPPKESE